jgi:hypothetical protein
MPFEILHSALVLLGGSTRLESAEVAPLAGSSGSPSANKAGIRLTAIFGS